MLGGCGCKEERVCGSGEEGGRIGVLESYSLFDIVVFRPKSSLISEFGERTGERKHSHVTGWGLNGNESGESWM